MILLQDRVVSNWWRKEGHKLHPSDLEDVVGDIPKVLVVGTGAYGRVDVLEETEEFLAEKGIKLIVEKTEEAVSRYNKLRTETELAAALHLTC